MTGSTAPDDGVSIGSVPSPRDADDRIRELARAPQYPGISVLPPAVVPLPPLLPSGLSDIAVAEFCARAYTGAVEARYRRRWRMFPKGVEQSKYRAILTAGGRTLAEQEIRPAAWAAWSVDVWIDFAGRAAARPPAVEWVYSMTRMEERATWFRSEGVAYLGGRAVYGEHHLELLRRWDAMRNDILGGMAAEAAADKWYPDGLYDVLWAKAEGDAREQTARFNAMVESGGWPW